MAGVIEPVSFSRGMEESTRYLVVPEEFVKDFDFSSSHIMIILRVTGPDTDMVTNFFDEGKGEIFTVNTTESQGKQISGEFILSSSYIDEGPHLSIDIDIEPPMVRAILDFKKK